MSIWSKRPTPVPLQQRSTVMWPDHLLLAQQSYADIDVSTMESGLRSVAFRSAVDLVASLASELPLHVYSGAGPDRRERTTPGYLEDPAGDGHGRPDWTYQAIESYLLRGNLYGDVLARSPSGFPTQILLHHPDDVGAWIDTDGNVQWSVLGRPVTDLSRFLHRRANPVPGRVLGLSPIAAHAGTLGLSLTTVQFGLQWFRDGAHPTGMLVNELEDLKGPEKAKTAKDRFMAALRGTREPVVMGRGWKYQQIQIAPEESQFLETQQFTAAECCHIIGPGIAEVLGYTSGGGLQYANVVDRDLHLLKYALNKWLRRMDRLYTEMLPRPQYARHDRDALLETNTLSRYQAHASALMNRWKTVNEVRSDEDMPPVEWGDQPNTGNAASGGTDQTQTGGEAAPKDGA